MKTLLDIIPLIVFFLIYRWMDIYAASAALIITSTIQVITLKLLYKTIPRHQIVNCLLVWCFGLLTLFYKNEGFVKWKASLLYLLFGVFLTASVCLKKPLLKRIFGSQFTLNTYYWNWLTLAWACFFFGCSGANGYLALSQPLETWIRFKTFGLPALLVLLSLLTSAYLLYHQRHATNAPSDEK